MSVVDERVRDLDDAVALGQALVRNLRGGRLRQRGRADGGRRRRPLRRPSPHRGRARRGQDGAGPDARRLARRRAVAGPGSPRPPPVRHHGRVGLHARYRELGFPARPGLRARGAGRRAEPHTAAHAVGAPRDDGGAAGQRGRTDLAAPATRIWSSPRRTRTRSAAPSRSSRASSTVSPWRRPSATPTRREEVQLALHGGGTYALAELRAVCTPEEWRRAQQATESVPVHEAVAAYAVELCRGQPDGARRAPRREPPRRHLAPPRRPGPRRARTPRAYVVPDDVKAVAVACLAHRILTVEADADADRSAAVIRGLLETTPAPRP